MARFTYGSDCSVPYDPSDHEHRKRYSEAYQGLDGRFMLPNAFCVLLAKVSRGYKASYVNHKLDIFRELVFVKLKSDPLSSSRKELLDVT